MATPVSRLPRQGADAASERPRLGRMLKDLGLLTATQLEYALQKQEVEQDRIGNILVGNGLVLEHDVAKVIAEQRGIPFVPASDLPQPDAGVLALFNRELCLANRFLPWRKGERGLEVLLGDSDPEEIGRLVMQRCDLPAVFHQTENSRLIQQIRQCYYFAQNPVEKLVRREIQLLASDVDNVATPARLLDHLLHFAIRERATDIHIAPSAKSWHVLFRIDGILRPMLAFPPALARLLTFVKINSQMDISEQRKPQDGSFHTVILDKPYTVRISTLVSEAGERMVLRLLPERGDMSGLLQLGYRKQDVSLLQRIFERPSGLVLITGPTGSGKSTTLHAALRMQSLIERNVLTVEDPVEYRVPGACQTEVNRRAGYDFGSALRNFLRHDPDVMLIGEIRDGETARAAVESAATGHLVLSTLHVANVFGVIPRLRPFGLGAQEIADNLVAIISQRLVRRVCPHCAQPQLFDQSTKEWLGEHHKGPGRMGAGCDACRGTGYLGRVPVYEILQVSQAIVTAIVDEQGRETLLRTARESGFQPMQEMARQLVADGQTTHEEIVRVLGEAAAEHDA
ncbi:GspE/PulE family protein [Pseudomarimonas salicorniae]|uniref:Flp pilus assembly complex ATPase component TadA n=1 Tax=Pseudomarimonas salicorniae TaxID=2933270 RepID=A0ABT0GGY9_9GAMM|nr:type II/IV secretion system protein [Lysobacter sp. CAU 1642]MCK7593791.1 Flp pilus assembly complex ATPase component TadA [Lysobacter sp. CAU 1642]